jgi:perosamine synthetase
MTKTVVNNPVNQEAAQLDCAAIVRAIRSVLPADRTQFVLHEPWFAGRERDYVLECIDTGWVSSGGRFVTEFEKMLAKMTGATCAVAVVNGTAALQVCLMLAGVARGDEVIIPDLTFVATANAVSYCGAMPHLVDSETKTLGMDAAKLGAYLSDIAEVRGERCINRRTGATIAAIVPMHTFGFPVDIDGLTEVCTRFHVPMVEDAAESLGSYYRGTHTGNFGRLAALSFNGNKTITTGGGGAILTNDPELGKLAKHLTTTARVPHSWAFLHDRVGYNFRMPNLNAALGCAQLEKLPTILEHKRRLAESYREAFATVPGVRFVSEPKGTRSNYWLNSLMVESGRIEDRDALLAATNDAGIMTRPVWTLMHELPMYAACPRMDVTIAERIEASLINLPSSAFLDVEHA